MQVNTTLEDDPEHIVDAWMDYTDVALSDALYDAKMRITDLTHWTREESARDRWGTKCLPSNQEALCWCAEGTLSKTCGILPQTESPTGNFPLVNLALRFLKMVIPDSGITRGIEHRPWLVWEINDQLGHQSVLDLYEHAIVRARTIEDQAEARGKLSEQDGLSHVS